MNKVNFFMVGAPKAGTTSIHQMLEQHPDIFMSIEKELHYFCTDLHQASDTFFCKKKHYQNRLPHNFEEHFKGSQGYKIRSESSTSYLYSTDAAKNIFEYNPDAKILICLREPVSLMYSWYIYLLSRSNEDLLTFSEAYESQELRQTGQNIPLACINPVRLQYDRIVDFVTNIKRYRQYFPSKQIKVIVFEEFINNPDRTFQEICSFLEIENIKVNVIKTNTAKEVKYPRLKRFIDENFSTVFRTIEKLNIPIISNLKEIYFNAFFKPLDRSKKPAKYLNELKKKYELKIDEIEQAAEIDNLKNIWYNEV